ncbi:MAG: hypothetical protein ABI878_02810 [Acidobacteriota bacterium]
MSAQFTEVLPNYGVDSTAISIPEMIVPLRGTNHIFLIDGDGLDVKAETPNMVEITESKDFIRGSLLKPRMFRLKGKGLPGKAGLQVVARRGTVVVARLRVFVLDNRIVKLAVRPLQTARGVYHAKVIPEIAAFVDQMNQIWTPQANVLIDLVLDSLALINNDPEENARAMGAFQSDGFTPDATQGVFQESIGMLSYSTVKSFGPVFTSFLDNDPIKNVEFTLFVVQAISTYLGSFTSGATDPSYKFALVRGDASSRVWAHELGHLLRKFHGESTVAGELMVSGGPDTDTKIPVKEAVEVFNGHHTVAPPRRK